MGLFFNRYKNHNKTVLVGDELDTKVDIIEHVHLEHRDELVHVLACFADVNVHSNVLPVIDDIYQEGVSIGYIVSTNTDTELSSETSIATLAAHPSYQTCFVPFRIKHGTLEEKFYYLAYEAAIKLDKPLGKNTLRYFEVIDTHRVTANMQRIHFKTEVAMPENRVGLAFSLVMTTMTAEGLQSKKTANENSEHTHSKLKKITHTLVKTLGKQANKVMFEVFKRLPERHRERVAKQTGKNQSRYYTLRYVNELTNSNSSQTNSCYEGYIDIFIHGDTTGGNWAKKLKQGEIFYSQRDVEERTAHLCSGQALLVCDETSLPTVAACLEGWQNPVMPFVVCVTHSESEHDYLSHLKLPALLNDTLDIVYLCYDTQTMSEAERTADRIIDIIEEKEKTIDSAWGALEVKTAKRIKKYLRETHQLSGKNNHIKGYWKKD